MDFANAALLIAAVFGVVELLKALVPALETNRRLTVLANLVVSLGVVYLVASTVWAHEQVIGGHPLDQLGVGDKAVVGIFLAGASAFGSEALKAVKNIGDNQPQKPIAK